MKALFPNQIYLTAVLAAGLLASLPLSGKTPESVFELDPYLVVGSPEGVYDIPGAAAFVDETVIRNFSLDNIDQAIRRVPGVYFRTEDGSGLFPNVSIRGVGSMRSSSVTFMEDGILSAPAPYSAPAAYYSPTTGRMRGIEVIKGSSQVRYGPQITGGAINYLSTDFPADTQGYLKLLYGSENERRAHVWYHDTWANEHGKFGYLAELYFRETDGFKSIDGTVSVLGSDHTGFRNLEPMLKFFWEPNSTTYQRWELKAGYTDRVADETYLGLTTDDFRADPFRRYAASRFDQIETEHFRTHVRYLVELDHNRRFTATAYYNAFQRAWYKLQDVNGGGGNISPSAALATPTSNDLAVLKGIAAGKFRVRNNAREYASFGLQTRYESQFSINQAEHNLDLGLRLHEDYEDRFQNQDTYTQDGTGAITDVAKGAPGSQDNRRGTTTALALSLSDRITHGAWMLNPGIRYEHARFDNQDDRPGRPDRTGTLDAMAYGMGVLYDPGSRHSVFANAYRGIALPGPSAVVNDGIREETSHAFELGYRFRDTEQALEAEIVLFRTEFDDLIVPDNTGGTGVGNGTTENVGEAVSQGVELSLRYDPARALQWSVRLPMYAAVTLTDATLGNDVSAGGGGGGAVESIFAGGRQGSKLPYVPDYQISFGVGWEHGRLGLHADAFYVDSTFGTASNTTSEQRPDGTPDARFGKNDSYFLLDLSGRYTLTESTKAIIGVNNALDREYLASRLPHGPRPGQARFWYGGIEMIF